MTISVVIPALNEAPRIVGAVESALRGVPSGAFRGGPPVEVIVVDGGSRDATVDLAREAGARVFGGLLTADRTTAEQDTPLRGRARQLRFGTEKSKGEVLLFLHADTRLPAGWASAVDRVMEDPDCAGGAFTFCFAERGGWERWIEFWTARRVQVLGLPYGDQALFVRRNVLEQMGGVPNVPIMEDLDLVRGIKRAGRLVMLPLSATTSSRRYRGRGALRTILWHQVALLYWALGWDRDRLAARMGR